jgi:sugar phosphate isomerase/epimerase
MYLGINTHFITRFDFEDGLKFCRALGLKGMEVAGGGQAAKEYCDLDRLLADEGELHRWQDTYARHGLTIVSLSCHGSPLMPDEAIAAEYKRQFKQACQLMAKIGVRRMTLVAGLPPGAPGDTCPLWITQQVQEPNMSFWRDTLEWQWERRLIPYWKEQAKIAADHGVTLCFEMQVSDMLHTPVKLKRFHDEIGPVVACNFDISHMWVQGIDPVTALRYLGPLVQHVHLKDAYINQHLVRLQGMNNTTPSRRPEDRSWNFTQIGWGHDESTWREVITTLRFIGYEDILSLEMECEYMTVEEGLRKSAEFIRPLLLTEPVTTKWWEHADWRAQRYFNAEAG